MEVVRITYDGRPGNGTITATIKRSTFDPRVLCTIEENAKIHHKNLKVLEVTTCHKLVVIKFTRPNAEDHIRQYLDGHEHFTKHSSCNKCKHKKVYCSINPKVIKQVQK